jgi:transketolase
MPSHSPDAMLSRAMTSTLIMAYQKGDAHVVSCLGTIEILCNLVRNEFDPIKDSLILSKGHASLALYSVLLELEVISNEQFLNFREEKSELGIHVSKSFANFSRLATGSLGHGIGFGAGIALANRINGTPGKVYVIVGDGELNEGSNFEALQIASTNYLNNLIVIVDHNMVQSVGTYAQVNGENTIADKFNAFGWNSFELKEPLEKSSASFKIESQNSKPTAFVYFSGVSPIIPNFQNSVEWHYRKPTLEDLSFAFKYLESHKNATEYLAWISGI